MTAFIRRIVTTMPYMKHLNPLASIAGVDSLGGERISIQPVVFVIMPVNG